MSQFAVALRKPAPTRAPERREEVVPAVDIREDDTGVTLLADLPGVPRDGLDIQVESDVLTIAGTARVDLPEGAQVAHAEWQGSPVYRRSFRLGREMDSGAIEASLRDGVLTLRIPKVAEARPRRITVQTG